MDEVWVGPKNGRGAEWDGEYGWVQNWQTNLEQETATTKSEHLTELGHQSIKDRREVSGRGGCAVTEGG